MKLLIVAPLLALLAYCSPAQAQAPKIIPAPGMVCREFNGRTTCTDGHSKTECHTFNDVLYCNGSNGKTECRTFNGATTCK
jgi:hypothetical protein